MCLGAYAWLLYATCLCWVFMIFTTLCLTIDKLKWNHINLTVKWLVLIWKNDPHGRDNHRRIKNIKTHKHFYEDNKKIVKKSMFIVGIKSGLWENNEAFIFSSMSVILESLKLQSCLIKDKIVIIQFAIKFIANMHYSYGIYI